MVIKIDQLSEHAVVQTKRMTNASAKDLFQESLKSILSGSSEGIVAGSDEKRSAALSEPQAVYPSQHTESTDEVATQTDRLIGLLETYATGLENPNATLKDLAPLVSRLKDEAEQLMVAAGGAPEEDGLRKIASQAALTANVEYIKFQRGDYI